MKKILYTLSLVIGFTLALSAQTYDGQTKVADAWPLFPGCENIDGTDTEIRECADQLLFDYIHSNLKYPEQARKGGVEGTVVITFNIDKNGKVSTPSIAKDLGSGCGEAALEVIQKMIKEEITWIPAQLEGENVSMEFSLPFRFSL